LKHTESGLRYLEFNEYSKLCSINKALRDDLICNILYETGCTVNELVNIRKKDLDLKAGQISIRSKNARNKESRTVFISKELARKIKPYLEENRESPYLFCTRQSDSITTKRVRQIVVALFNKIGITDGSPQVLRYTHIVHAYKRNIPLAAIQKQVGLKRSRAIEIFSQLPVNDMKGAYSNFTKNA